MRYLNISMLLASTVLLTLACGGSGTDGADDATDTETAGDGDGDSGDGDGDGGDGDGDTGDGDGDTGDGDGDTGDGDGDTGDGDGDGDGGDGDGDQGCPPGNTACESCMAENCCDELMACAANQTCACLSECIGGGAEPEACFGECMVGPGNMPQELMDVRTCQLMSCMEDCAMP